MRVITAILVQDMARVYLIRSYQTSLSARDLKMIDPIRAFGYKD